MAQIDITIGGIAKAKAELESLKQAIESAEDSGKKTELTQRYDDLSDSLKRAKDKFNELESSGKRLSARFDEIYGDIQPLTGRIGELEDRLYELALAGQQNTDEFKNIQTEVGRMKKVIIDVDKSVDLLSENQGFAVFGAGLSNVGERLMSLDFAGAAKDATQLNASVGNLGQMGSQALKGLSTTVVQVGKAFMSVGLSLLTNPIFLIAAAIVAIVAAIALLLNKLGILKPILNAIGKVFEWVMSIIEAVIEAFKMLTDWLGITTYKSDKMAQAQIDNSKKVQEAYKKQSEAIIDGIDREMRIRQASGKDTFALEKQKQKVMSETAIQTLNALKDEIIARAKLGDVTKEEIEELKKKVAEQKKVLKDSNTEIQVLDAKHNKEMSDKHKESLKDRLNALRSIQDMELELMKEGRERELKANQIKYKRLIEDTKSNEKLTASEKKKIIEELSLLEVKYRDEINQKYIKQEKEKQEKINQAIKNAQEIRLQAEEDFYESFRQATTSKQQLEIDEVNDKYFQLIEQAKQYGEDVTELEKKQKEELDKINEEYRVKQLVKEQALKQAKLDLVSGGLSATQQLIEAFAGKSEAQQRKAFQLQKAVSIAQAVMDTYKGANAIFASAAANPASVLFPAQPFIQAGLAIAAGIANVKKIASTQFGGGATPSASASGGGSMGGGTSTQAATPNVSLFGQNNNANNLTSTQSMEANQGGEMVVKAVVVESDITNAQNKANKFKSSGEL